MRRFFCALGIGLSAFTLMAANCSFTIGASDAGWYNASGYHDALNRSYFAGHHASSGMEFRDWFVFNLPVFDKGVIAAELRLFTFDIRSTNGSVTLELRHVATPVATLTNGGTGRFDVFNDLGDGTVYATRTFSSSEHDSFVSMPLNSSALAALTAASGQRFAIGGRLSSIPGGTNDHSLFGYSVGSATYVQLVVFIASTDAPTFVSLPVTNYFTTSGSTARLTVEACGALPLHYRWFFNGAPVPNQTNAMLTIANVSPANAGDYFAVVTNVFGAITSSVTHVFVDARPPNIFSLTYNPEVEVGGQINIQASVDGLPYPVLQWQFNGHDIPGGTNSILSIDNAQLTNAGTYTVIASNAYGAISRSFVINVLPYLIYGPYDVTFSSGTDSYLSVFVSGFLPSTYQWRFNGANIPGADAASLPFFNVSAASTGRYDVVVSNSSGVRTSAVAQVSVMGAAPTFDGPRASGGMIVDGSFTLYVNVFGSSPLQLQWYFNNAPIASATNAQLGFERLATNHTGLYSVVATNAFGVATSFQAYVNVQYQSPIVAMVVPSLHAYAGDTRRLLAHVEGGPRPEVQWQFGGTNIPGATNVSLLLTNLTLEQKGDYVCVATNLLGAQQATASLNVTPRRALDRWTWRNPRPQANDLHHIVFGNGRYVAGGEGGALVTSTNGTDWTAVPLNNEYSVVSLASGNGVFAALISDSAGLPLVFTSDDGLTWAPREIPGLHYLTTIAFAKGEFHAYGLPVGGATPRQAVSVNGVTWNSTLAPSFAFAPDSLAYGNGIYVAAAYYYFFVSTDGVQFTRVAVPNSGFRRITFGNGQFIAVGYYGGIWTSTDGIRWTQRNSGTVLNLAGLAAGNGRFIVVGDDGTLLTSTDGAAWTAGNPGTGKNLNDVLFDGTQFMLCGNDGVILTSADGAIWTDRRGGRTDDLEGIVYTNGLFVAVGGDGTILTSINGMQWTARNSPNSRNLHDITYAAGQFVAVGQRGTVLTSPNGINWTSRSTPTTNYLQRVTYGNGRYVAVGTGGTVIGSTNGIQWQLHSNNLPANTEMEGVAFGKGRFVIVGGYFAQADSDAHSITLVSTNGTDWLAVSNDVGKILRGVAFGNDHFQAVGNDGITVFSTNGLDWLAPDSVLAVPPYQNLRHITYAAGRFIAVGNEGAVVSLRSNWIQHASIVSQNLHDIAFGAGKFVAVGNEGAIVQSDDALPVFSTPGVTGGAVRFNLHGGMESEYRVQSSENLLSWTNVAVFTNSGASVTFSNGAGARQQFFRAVSP